MNNLKEKEKRENLHSVNNAVSLVLTSFFIYLFWLGVHLLFMKIFGSPFDFDNFIGADKGIAYFLPFLMGLGMMINEFFLGSLFRSEKGLTMIRGLNGLFLFYGCYFMLVNYLAWIAR